MTSRSSAKPARKKPASGPRVVPFDEADELAKIKKTWPRATIEVGIQR